MTVTGVFGLIVSIFKAIPIIESWFQQFAAWYINRQTSKTLSMIADAAALSARSKTDADRYAAAAAWRAALSRDRQL